MISLLGLKENVTNIARLGGPARDSASLKANYRRFLSKRQPVETLGHGPKPVLQPLMAYFGEVEESPWQSKMRAGLDNLGDTRALFDLAVNVIFAHDVPTRGGGSSPKAIGVVWANPKPEFEAEDTAELLVHELTHQLVFLDHMVHRHFEPGVELGLSPSAIRATPRRSDLVFHSVVVGAEILAWRRRAKAGSLAHPPTDRLRAQCATALRALVHEPALTARGHEVLARCRETL